MKFNEAKVLELINAYRTDNKATIDTIQAGMFDIDLRYHRADSEYIASCEKAKLSNKAVPENVQPPILLEQTEGLVAYLSSVFLRTNPIFKPKLAPGLENEETKLEELMQGYQDTNMWIAEELQALRNVVKHNLSATLVEWKAPDIAADAGRAYSQDPEGLTNTTLSLYDCLWDTETEPKDFNSEGMYFEWNRYKSRHKMRRLLRTLSEVHKTSSGNKIDKLLEKEPKEGYDRVLALRNLREGKSGRLQTVGQTDYKGFFDSEGENYKGHVAPTFSFKGHRLSLVYLRATDVDMGYVTSNSKRFNIYKVMLLDDNVIYVEPLDLPNFEVILSAGIVDDFGYDTKSIVEPVVLFQDLATKLIKAKLAASRRAMHDRAVYNPLYLKSADVNNTSDALKMPIRRSQWFDPDAVNKAYRALPFEDSTARDLMADASLFMNDLPSRATGLSEFRRSPVRGNKSKGQFELESQAADGRGFSLALTLEASRYTSVRNLMRIHLVTNTPSLGEDVDWTKLLDKLKFSVSDGLSSLGMFDNLDNLQGFMQLGAQNPQFAPMVANIMKYVLAAKTPFTVSDFQLDTVTAQPPEPAQEQAPNQEGDPNATPTNGTTGA